MFVDTDANCNTISRRFFDDLAARGLVAKLIKGPEAGVRINLVGGQNLMISGDEVKMEVNVATNMGIKTLIQDFLILENDAESLVMRILHWLESNVENGEYRHLWGKVIESLGID